MWQDDCSNGVMSATPDPRPDKPENVRLPAEFRAALRAMIPRVGSKKKWQLYAASLLAFLRLPRHEQDGLLAGIRAADFPGGSYQPLIDEMKAAGGRMDPRDGIHEGLDGITRPGPSAGGRKPPRKPGRPSGRQGQAPG